MSSTNHSSELLNVSGRKKTLDDLVSTNEETTNKKGMNDNASMFPTPLGDKTTFAVGKSDILSRVQAFLPQLKNANEQLQNADPSKLDIENVDEEDGQYIEMNLGLGVYEEKRPEQSDSDDEDDVDEENSDDEKIIIPNSTPADRSKKPSIEIIEK